MANNTIAENIRKAIDDFDSIESVLQTNGKDTTNIPTSEYSTLIQELLSYSDTLTPAEYDEALEISNKILEVVDPPTYIFLNGVFSGINTFQYISLGGATTGTLTIGTTIATSQKGQSVSGAEYKLVSDLPIDLTNISKLEIKFSTNASKNCDFKIAIPTSHSNISSWNSSIPDVLYSTQGNYSGTMTLDVSNYIGKRYLLFRLSAATYGGTRTLTINHIKAIK